MPPKPTPNATLEGPLRDLNLQIPIETLDIRLMDSHEYQRKLDDGLVDQILETFHANAGPYQEHTTTYVHVAHNPKDPSRYVILDGRHRIEAARKFNRLSHSYKILTWRAFIHPAKRLIDPLLDQWISGWNAPHKGMLRTSAELLERMMKWDDVNIERCQQLLQLNPKHVGYINRLYKKGTYKSLRNFIVQGSVFETISLRQMASVLTKEGDFAEWFTPLLIMDVTCQQSRLHNIPEIRHKIHHLLKGGADVTSLYNTISELDPKLAPEETFCKWETSFLDLDSSSDWVFGRKLFGLKDLSNMDILFSDWQNRVEFLHYICNPYAGGKSFDTALGYWGKVRRLLKTQNVIMTEEGWTKVLRYLVINPGLQIPHEIHNKLKEIAVKIETVCDKTNQRQRIEVMPSRSRLTKWFQSNIPNPDAWKEYLKDLRQDFPNVKYHEGVYKALLDMPSPNTPVPLPTFLSTSANSNKKRDRNKGMTRTRKVKLDVEEAADEVADEVESRVTKTKTLTNFFPDDMESIEEEALQVDIDDKLPSQEASSQASFQKVLLQRAVSSPKGPCQEAPLSPQVPWFQEIPPTKAEEGTSVDMQETTAATPIQDMTSIGNSDTTPQMSLSPSLSLLLSLSPLPSPSPSLIDQDNAIKEPSPNLLECAYPPTMDQPTPSPMSKDKPDWPLLPESNMTVAPPRTLMNLSASSHNKALVRPREVSLTLQESNKRRRLNDTSVSPRSSIYSLTTGDADAMVMWPVEYTNQVPLLSPTPHTDQILPSPTNQLPPTHNEQPTCPHNTQIVSQHMQELLVLVQSEEEHRKDLNNLITGLSRSYKKDKAQTSALLRDFLHQLSSI
ncbi:hypothetical protein FRC14_001765 [Serendipita sp. 396]|nr:hypothetical protein FRC14_001765 [Serendipita sp. 396]KAG8773853.1 hypothetical protein FRC15_001720 [Serendipita sp. 397]KAG8854510.1 hypothetical protein FRC20_000983 [Serendipita sp. 405]